MNSLVTYARLADALRRAGSSTDNPGFCLACGEEVDGVKPDARGYECECCGEPKVYGADEVLLMGAYS